LQWPSDARFRSEAFHDLQVISGIECFLTNEDEVTGELQFHRCAAGDIPMAQSAHPLD
jgi:hypothetical protein